MRRTLSPGQRLALTQAGYDPEQLLDYWERISNEITIKWRVKAAPTAFLAYLIYNRHPEWWTRLHLKKYKKVYFPLHGAPDVRSRYS